MRKSRTGTAGEPACPPFTPTTKVKPRREPNRTPRTQVVIRDVHGRSVIYFKSITLHALPRDVLKLIRIMADEAGFAVTVHANSRNEDDAVNGDSWVDELDQADAVTIPLQHLDAAGKGVDHA